MSDDIKKEALERKKKLLLEQKQLMEELPHLYGWPWYKWAYDFFNSTNRTNLLCAANQISKSSTQIRKAIHWCTAQNLWPKLWARNPNQFWYLYPSKEVATIEFEKKWEPEFMPRGAMKRSPYYGWTAEYDHKYIKAIHFNSGASLYFKTYAQNPKTLQSGSCYGIFCDEELPIELYDELNFRIAGTNGYFHMVFTATLNQEFWWRAMEAGGTDQEVLTDAWKRQISMYDCLEYVDGSATPWTVERIKQIEKTCKSQAEVMRRVHGRFIKEEGRKYHAFDPTQHYCTPFEIPKDYTHYVGVDIGSGGDVNHPAAIVFIAVRPDYKKGYVYKGWRGDGVQTTSGDVFNKFLELRDPKTTYVMKKYDGAAKDFGTISDRLGGGFTKAEKSHEIGEEIVNTLYAHNMLEIFDTDELRKLGVEMLNVQKTTPKNKAKDDFADAQRYGVVEIPWDFSAIMAGDVDAEKTPEKLEKRPMTREEWFEYEQQLRRGRGRSSTNEGNDWAEENDSEIEFWNSQAGN